MFVTWLVSVEIGFKKTAIVFFQFVEILSNVQRSLVEYWLIAFEIAKYKTCRQFNLLCFVLNKLFNKTHT